MRITVGGVLIIGCAVATGYFVGISPQGIRFKIKLMEYTKTAGSLVGLYKAGDASNSEKEVYSPPPPLVNATPTPASPSPLSDVNTDSLTSTQTAAVSTLGLKTTASSPIVNKKTATSKKSTRKKTTSRKRTATVKATPKKSSTTSSKTVRSKTTSKATPSDPINKLIGTYVSLELNTGRSVQGILKSRTETDYIIDVPGLGPLAYTIRNVRSISPAE